MKSRFALQRLGPGTLSRHLRRALLRGAVLVLADLATFLVLGSLLFAVRDQSLLGSWLGAQAQRWVPGGHFGAVELGVALLVGLVVTGNYGRGDSRKDIGKLFVGVALGVALTMWGSLWELGFRSPVTYVVVVVTLWAAFCAERLLLDRMVRVLGWRRPRARTVFVGQLEACHGAATGPAFGEGSQYRVVGFVDIPPENQAATVEDLRDALLTRRAETVVICGYLEEAVFAHLTQAVREAGCQLLAVPRRFGSTGVKPQLVWECDQPLIALTSPALTRRHLIVKRVVDMLGAGLGLLVLSPLFAVVAVAIKLDSRGSVFFRHERVGYGGRVFKLVKFRTMRQGADGEKADVAHLNYTGDPRLFKIPGDPRVTRLGTFLRKWSIDELPQLWNVLWGAMSLVGPRPFFESDLEGYADHHLARLGVKPGITGLWQVKGRSAVVNFEEVVRLDREYIDRWSLSLDLKILLLTIPAVARRSGAL